MVWIRVVIWVGCVSCSVVVWCAQNFPRYTLYSNMKYNVENEILSGIFHVVSRFPLHFVLYLGNCDICHDVDTVVVICTHDMNSVYW